MVNTARLNPGLLAILASILNPIKSYVYVPKNSLRMAFHWKLGRIVNLVPCPLAIEQVSHLKVLYPRSKLKYSLNLFDSAFEVLFKFFVKGGFGSL